MTGEVLHFVGIPGLKDYVFVSPTWLIDVIKCVISPALQNTLDTAPSSDSRYESSVDFFLSSSMCFWLQLLRGLTKMLSITYYINDYEHDPTTIRLSVVILFSFFS